MTGWVNHAVSAPSISSIGAKTCTTWLNTTKPTTAATPVEPSPLRAKPTAIPTANSSGSQLNSPPPAAANTFATSSVADQPPSMSSWPSRDISPAAGRVAIGSMRLRPNRCRPAKARLRPGFSVVVVTRGLPAGVTGWKGVAV